jgi:hypothetical protein
MAAAAVASRETGDILPGAGNQLTPGWHVDGDEGAFGQ